MDDLLYRHEENGTTESEFILPRWNIHVERQHHTDPFTLTNREPSAAGHPFRGPTVNPSKAIPEIVTDEYARRFRRDANDYGGGPANHKRYEAKAALQEAETYGNEKLAAYWRTILANWDKP